MTALVKAANQPLARAAEEAPRQYPTFMLRGEVVPVVDLASRFGGKPGEVTRRSCTAILELEVENMAVLDNITYRGTPKARVMYRADLGQAAETAVA